MLSCVDSKECIEDLLISLLEEVEYNETGEEKDFSYLKEEFKNVPYEELLKRLIEIAVEEIPHDKEGNYDSHCYSVYADILYFLSRKGYFIISYACSRRIKGKFVSGFLRVLEGKRTCSPKSV